MVDKLRTADDGLSYCYECADLMAHQGAVKAGANGMGDAPKGVAPLGEFVIDIGRNALNEDLGGLQEYFASFVAAHTELSERRSELLLELRGVEAQLLALNDRAGRVNSILDGGLATDATG